MLTRLLVAAIIAISALTVPVVQAQGERILVDMEIETLPGRETGHCIAVQPGTVSATIQSASEGGAAGVVPVRLMVLPVRLYADSERINAVAETVPTTHTLPVEQGVYCYMLRNEGPRLQGQPTDDQLRRFAQFVTLRLTWNPPV